MADLSQDDVRKLLDSGVSPEEIMKYVSLGDGAAGAKIQNVLAGTGKRGGGKLGFSVPQTDFGGALAQTVGGSAYAQNRAPKKSFAGSVTEPWRREQSVGGTPSIPRNATLGRGIGASALVKLTSGRGASNAGGLANALTRLNSAKGNFDRIYELAKGAQADQNAQAILDAMGGSSVPGEEFQQPNFERRDFSREANELAASAYGPRYAAIDSAVQGAHSNYARSDKVTAGLYQNLANQIAATAAATKDRYAAATQEQAARTAELQKNIGQTYDSSAQALAQRAGEQGNQAALPDVLARDAGESSFQQSQAAIQGNAQQGGISQQGQGQQDYLTNVGNAEATQGVVSRENLLNDLTNVLRMYDQQRMGVAGDQSNTALELSQSLTDQDLQLQQANYGGYRDAYSARQDAANQTSQSEAQRAEMAYQMQQDQQGQANRDRDYELDVNKWQTGLQTELAKLQADRAAQGQQGLAEKPDPVSNTVNQVADSLGGDTQTATTYYKAVDQWVRELAGRGQNLQFYRDPVSFAQAFSDDAGRMGLDKITAQRVAAAYWKNLLDGNQGDL